MYNLEQLGLPWGLSSEEPTSQWRSQRREGSYLWVGRSPGGENGSILAGMIIYPWGERVGHDWGLSTHALRETVSCHKCLLGFKRLTLAVGLRQG